jgi:hypothetical protein
VIRVIDPDGNVEDFEANHFEVTFPGALVLNRYEIKQGIDPSDMRLKPQFESKQMVAILGPGTWSRVDNLDLADEREIVAQIPQEMNA